MKPIVLAFLLLAAAPAMAQVSCIRTGNFTGCSDGTSYVTSGNFTSGSDGSSMIRSGGMTTYTPGYTLPQPDFGRLQQPRNCWGAARRDGIC